MSPVVGQWSVARTTWGYRVGEIRKVTDKQIRALEPGSRGESHYQRDQVVFAGTEADARRLLDVLVSLNDRHTQAKRQLSDQHRARIISAIAAALGSAEVSA